MTKMQRVTELIYVAKTKRLTQHLDDDGSLHPHSPNEHSQTETPREAVGGLFVESLHLRRGDPSVGGVRSRLAAGGHEEDLDRGVCEVDGVHAAEVEGDGQGVEEAGGVGRAHGQPDEGCHWS